jgi:hypothetical protein
MTDKHTSPVAGCGAVTSTEARDTGDIIEHLLSHVGGNHHTLGPRGSRPLLDGNKAVCVQLTAPDDKEDKL